MQLCFYSKQRDSLCHYLSRSSEVRLLKIPVLYLFVVFWILYLLVNFSATHWQRIIPFYVSRVASKDTLREHQLSPQKYVYTLLLLAILTILYADHWSSLSVKTIRFVDNVSVGVFASCKPRVLQLFSLILYLYITFLQSFPTYRNNLSHPNKLPGLCELYQISHNSFPKTCFLLKRQHQYKCLK